MDIALKKKKKKVREVPNDGALFSNLRMEMLDSNEDAYVNLLVYGLTGVGKTRFLGSAQKCLKTSPIFYIAVDPGTVSIEGSGIEVFRPQTFKEIQDAYNFLRFENTRFKSVGLDSLTEMHDKLSMGNILGVLQDDASYSNLDSHVPATQYDWLSSGEQMRRTIRAFRDLAYSPEKGRSIHVFMTALERVDEKRSIICPSLPGALGLGIGASIDILARLSIEKREVEEGKAKKVRHMSFKEGETEENMKFVAKARTPLKISFPNEIWKPTIDMVLRYWTGEKTDKEEAE